MGANVDWKNSKLYRKDRCQALAKCSNSIKNLPRGQYHLCNHQRDLGANLYEYLGTSQLFIFLLPTSMQGETVAVGSTKSNS